MSDRPDLLGHCRAEIVAACRDYYFPHGGDEHTYDGQFEAIADKVLESPAHQQLKGAVDSAVAQTRSLMDAIERDLNDVGPWGNGYRQALADLREQLTLRFGGSR